MIELLIGFAVIVGVCIAVLFGVVRWILTDHSHEDNIIPRSKYNGNE